MVGRKAKWTIPIAVAAVAAAAVLASSLQACYATATMPPRELFEMGQAASAMGSLACVVTAALS